MVHRSIAVSIGIFNRNLFCISCCEDLKIRQMPLLLSAKVRSNVSTVLGASSRDEEQRPSHPPARLSKDFHLGPAHKRVERLLKTVKRFSSWPLHTSALSVHSSLSGDSTDLHFAPTQEEKRDEGYVNYANTKDAAQQGDWPPYPRLCTPQHVGPGQGQGSGEGARVDWHGGQHPTEVSSAGDTLLPGNTRESQETV